MVQSQGILNVLTRNVEHANKTKSFMLAKKFYLVLICITTESQKILTKFNQSNLKSDIALLFKISR